MKNILFGALLLVSWNTNADLQYPETKELVLPVTGNVFIITTDGFRWQEVFNGADSALINNETVTPDTATLKMMYWGASAEERRKKLMPFFWNVIAQKGQLYGNRLYHNKVNVSNIYAISYPGYNEIFTGNDEYSIYNNNKNNNPNVNVLEYLNSKEKYKGRVAIFSSWDVLPYILNEQRSGLNINAGYKNLDDSNLTPKQEMVNKVQQEAVYDKGLTRMDDLTFVAAKEYIKKHQPSVMYLSLGQTDEFAHNNRYDLYLQQAANVDKMIAELWHLVQTTPGYKNNTSFIITTDHGRGKKPGKWSDHGFFTEGSSQTWLAVMGPGIEPLGEVKENGQIYQKQLAQTIAGLLGERFEPGKHIRTSTSLASLQ